MKMFWRLLFILVALFPAWVNAYNPTNVQKTISGLIEAKMQSRAVTSADPRWGSTLQSAGASIAGAAAAAAVVTAAGVTAPAWVTVAGTVALSALIGVGIDLAVDGLKWLFNSDGSVSYSGASSGVGMTAGGPYWSASGWSVYGGSPKDVAAGWAQRHNVTGWSSIECQGNGAAQSCYLQKPDTSIVESLGVVFSPSGAPATCAGTSNGSDCQAVPDLGGGQQVTKSPNDAIKELTETQKAKPVNPAVIAKIADAAWQKAASQPDYRGVPYDPGDPITQADAAAFQNANPAHWPKVQDIVTPQVSNSAEPGTAYDPFKLPNSAAEPAVDTGTTPPVTVPTDKYDWAIPSSGENIERKVVPVSYTPTIFASPTGCPQPIHFEMFGKEYAINYVPMCDLMTTVAPIFLALGAAAAALIFMESLKS